MDLPLHLDRASERALHLQLANQLRQAILDGLLVGGTQLPSTRSLAETLGVSRNVVLAAYDELFAEGYTETRRGSGTYVLGDLPVRPSRRPEPSIDNPRWLKPAPPPMPFEPPVIPGTIDFRMGKPSLDPLPPRTWQRLWREMALETPPTSYGPVAGYEELREAIAAYLGRSRGISCRAEDVIITSGAVQALDLIARATLEPGDRVVHEEPGYQIVHTVLGPAGVEIVPVPVDDDGLCVDLLPRGADAPVLVYTTPSHQYPTGARLPVSRRLALIEWACEHDSLIIEDDYDSEFRFDAAPLPAMAGLDETGRVVYVGTFSKMLTPALRVGYVVATPVLRERLVQLKRAIDWHSPWPTQAVLARFLSSGRLEAHIARMRRHYARNRACLTEAFAPIEGLARLQGLEAGLHVYLELHPALDTERIVEEALAHKVVVTSIGSYFQGQPDRCGLLLGYGGLTVSEIEQGASVLVRLIREEARRSLRTTTRPSA